jgi:hypothetical protein
LHKRWWLGGEHWRQFVLLVEAHILLVILIGTCHAEAAEQS